MKNAATAVNAADHHINQIDGLRAIAILMVFVHHAFNVPLLWAGVDLFFILSGFLITQILVRDCGRMNFAAVAKRFYTRRAQRILPAYLLFMLAAVPLVPIAWTHLWPCYAFFAQNFPVAFGWIPPNVLDPLWSLGVENQFYLVWPLVVFFLPRKWLAPGMVAVLLGEPILRFVATPWFPTAGPIYALTPFRLDALAAGALLALVLPTLRQQGIKLARLWSPVVAVAATLVIVACTHHYPWFRRTANVATFNSVAYSLNIAVLGACFVAAYYSRGWAARLLSSRPLAHMGRISYMFYLSHLFFMYYAGVLIHSRMVSTAVAFVATTAFASAMWVLVERPILNWGRKPVPAVEQAPQQESFPLAA